jgi:hypothetical protein
VFAGDSLAAGPSWALWEDQRTERLSNVMAEYQVGTGLVRPDYWDWYHHLAGVMAARHPQVVVFMAGANDAQDVVVGGQDYPVGTASWSRVYRGRVGALMALLAAGGRTLIWCGMPPMENLALSGAMAREDRIFQQEAARHPGVRYLDTWKLFSGPDGAFTPNLAVDGHMVPVRLSDGVHLNVAGSFLLAKAILREVTAGVEHAAPTPIRPASS